MERIAFLRGINVGGHMVKMERLRAILSSAGFEGVRTYIQSGNVFFDSDEPTAALENRFEEVLKKELGYDVPTFVRSVEEVRSMLGACPFARLERAEDERHIVLFARPGLVAKVPLPAKSEKGDSEVVGHTDAEIFVRYWVVNGRPADPTKLLKSTFGPVENSGRFFHTLRKMVGQS